MRTFIFLFCTAVFSFTPKNVLSQNAKIKIVEDKTLTVDEVFTLITDQTEYSFIYQADLFKDFPKVNLKKGVVPANMLLNNSLATGSFNFKFTNSNTVIILKKTDLEKQQEITITGQVVDASGLPVPGITVYVSNQKPEEGRRPINQDFLVRGTVTDFDGSFSLVTESGHYLAAYGLGYEYYFTEITANKIVYNITLKENVSALDEVIVVGYGSTTKRDLTGSVTTINAEEIAQAKTQSIERALYGKVPGVMVTGSGQPGATASVVIRGLSQINGDNQPLYVIDGIPMNLNANTRNSDGLLQQGTRSNPLLAINPADIKNVSVLKDASAAGIYGSRAANGVIIITTKRGKRGAKPRFTFSTNTTFQNPQSKIDYLGIDGYKDYYTTQADLAGRPVPTFGDANTNWQDEIINENALWNDYRISLSGGSDNLNYFVSGNVQNQESIFINNKFKRYSFAASLDADVTDKLRVGVSINYNNAVDRANGLNTLDLGEFRPDRPVFDENGVYTDNGFLERGSQPGLNPVGDFGRIRNEAISKNVLTSVYAELEIVKNLRFKSQFSANQSNDDVNNFTPSFSVRGLTDALNGNLISRGDPGIGILETQINKSKNIVFSNTLTYNNTFNDKHTLNAVAGLSWDSTEIEALGVNFAGFPDDFVLTNAGSATTVFNGGSDYAQKALNSFFGRVNYNYDDRYLLTLTGRADRSTQFGEDNRTGFFPSAGLAWNMHNEGFLKNNKTINQLKLRVSAGRTGNDNLPAFLFRPVMAVESSRFDAPTLYNGINGFRLQGVPNESLRWEETDQLDIGLEFRLFNNRINAEIVWFDKSTSDLILLTPISAQTGFSTFYSNIADVSNKGWEFLVGGDIFRTKDFTWNSSFNISFIKSNVDALKGGQSDSFNNFGVIEGYPLGQIFGRDIVGIAQNQAEIDALNAGAIDGQYDSNLLAPGDYIARDVNGDGQYTQEDAIPLANGNDPDFFGGWNNTINYKNFDMSFNFQFVQGLDKIRRPDANLSFVDFNRMPNLMRDDVLNAWTPDNPNAKYPRVGSRFYNGNVSRYVSDASYVSLRSASIGYNVPSEILQKVGISNAKFTLSGNNLIIIHNYDGPDPESTTTRGVTNTSLFDSATDIGFTYPNVRSFTIGLNVTF